MTKNIRIIFWILVLLVIIGGMMSLYIFHKPHRNIANEKSAYILGAHEIYKAFSENEKKANKKFLGKAIEVYGIATELPSKTCVVVRSEGKPEGGVQCEMDAMHQQTTEGLTIGQKVRLRGQCDGLLLDVVLSKGVLLK